MSKALSDKYKSTTAVCRLGGAEERDIKEAAKEKLKAEAIEAAAPITEAERPADIVITKEQMEMAAASVAEKAAITKVTVPERIGNDAFRSAYGKGEDHEINKCRELAGLPPVSKKNRKCLQCGDMFLTTPSVRICNKHAETKAAFLAKGWECTP